jgi:glycosyltransferase involved in cell wall biosynthesis
MVVVPSVSHSGGPETFGRTVIEAWAWRKPVVAYACGAVAGLIEDGVDGLLVPEGDVEALAEALHRLSTAPDLCRRLGEAGHARVLRDYEAGAVTRRLLDALAAG